MFPHIFKNKTKKITSVIAIPITNYFAPGKWAAFTSIRNLVFYISFVHIFSLWAVIYGTLLKEIVIFHFSLYFPCYVDKKIKK